MALIVAHFATFDIICLECILTLISPVLVVLVGVAVVVVIGVVVPVGIVVGDDRLVVVGRRGRGGRRGGMVMLGDEGMVVLGWKGKGVVVRLVALVFAEHGVVVVVAVRRLGLEDLHLVGRGRQREVGPVVQLTAAMVVVNGPV